MVRLRSSLTRPPLNSSSLGAVDMGTVEKVEVQITDAEKARLERMENRPSLDQVLNLHDLEVGTFVSVSGSSG